MGPTRVGSSPSSPEDGNEFSFRKIVFSSYLEILVIESTNPVILSVTASR
jgi:hypothetical protein